MPYDSEKSLRDIIKAAMNAKNGKPTQKNVKLQPRADAHGRLGDASRSGEISALRASIRDVARFVPEEFEDKESGLFNTTIVVDGVRHVVQNKTKAPVEVVNLRGTGVAPSKKQSRLAARQKRFDSNRVFKTTGPGSSRSTVVDRIVAIASKETGCIVRKREISEEVSRKNCNTTVGNYTEVVLHKLGE